ncbi:MAG: hypothetical protein QXT63_02465 [Thermoplasmata archaeon]
MAEDTWGKDPYSNMWILNTTEKIKNLTWWWWWWIFFIDNPIDKKHPRQFMILWSTKNCNRIKVMDHLWTPKKPIKILMADGGKALYANEPNANLLGENRMEFNGMTAAWWFDGKKMHDPYILEESDFYTKWVGDEGILVPESKEGNIYTFEGNTKNYKVHIKFKKGEFLFNMEPWNEFMSKHVYNVRHYTKKMGYNILKIRGMKLSGFIDENGKKEEIAGSAYFQRLMVNAPAVPWYWGIFHIEDGSYIDYMFPFIGPQMFRNTEKPRSILDWGDIKLSKSVEYYVAETGKLYNLKLGSVKKEFSKDNLPIFLVEGHDKQNKVKLKMRLEAYSRAYWRFEQKNSIKSRIFFYNEYPVVMTDFSFVDNETGLKKSLDDLGKVVGNCEHSWGRLF